MARRKRIRRKRMTITEQYNRYAIGLEYFGESFETKKRATSKGLKELKKHYYKLRKELREQGRLDLPTIAQAQKEVLRRREEQSYRDIDDDLEPLPYMEGDLEQEENSYTYVLEFKAIIETYISTMELSKYGPNFVTSAIVTASDAYVKLQGIIEAHGEAYVEDYLANSTEFDALTKNTFQDYDDAKEGAESIESIVDAMLADVRGETGKGAGNIQR